MHNRGHADIEASRGTGESSLTRSQVYDASQFVRNGQGDLIDVSGVSPDDRYARGPYSCLACGQLMVPALGRIRKHHFKHKAGRPVNCHNETYLHQLAKMVLFAALSDAIQTGQPYWLTRDRPVVCSYYQEKFGISCTTQSAPYRTDLAAMFDRAEMEVGVDGFVADILLSSSRSDARLLLEIAVTHPCEETKIASGLPIIEIEIWNEDAAIGLWEGIDAASRSNLYHNIPSPDAAPHLCTTPCPATGLAVLLYESGKAWYSELVVGNHSEKEILSDFRLVTSEIVDVQLGPLTRPWKTIEEHLNDFMIRQAFEHGRSVKSCMLCRNNGGRVNEHDIFCEVKARNVWMSSSAIGCTDFDPPNDIDEARLMFGRLGRS
ncbi:MULTISPECIES: hypothetical protein [unclassified Yoonia]|uniref:hypothetical protein n=1 Tax=unclassified Yoonia TaxID=2629118 RepID=UPI002AFF45C3|nr:MULTISPECIES: hypothetical protein [unclassified Yoonia]